MFNPKQPFDLKELPPKINLSTHPKLNEFLKTATTAQKEISELKGVLASVENPEILLSSFYLQESVNSNAVENIHTTIESVLADETKPEQERSYENKEVINYRDALLAGHRSLKKFGLSTRTIKTIHKSLNVSKGVAGEYREQQNNISNQLGDGQSEIIYTPPAVRHINQLIGNWESFAEKNSDFLPLMKAAICHYQFEAIHPFEDGNGRAGRILMVLQLIQDDLLDYPALFISGYLSKYGARYKKLLQEVTTEGNWWDFIEFILVGFAYQALKAQLAIGNLNLARLRLILQLKGDATRVIKIPIVNVVVNHIFENPRTQAKFMEKSTGIHWQTCTKYLNYLSTIKVLSVEKSGRYKFFSNRLALSALKAKPPTD